jgi:bifunctional non-homologous end joining protein LigD
MPARPRPRATTDRHPAVRRKGPPVRPVPDAVPADALVPPDRNEVVIALGDREVKLTNLQKPFWPDLGLTKGDLIRYYVEVAPALLPHVRDRAMVMKRYPNGAAGPFFFMKRAPQPRPVWIETCAIEHASGNVIDFPMIQDLPALLWVINLGCIDLNQYARWDEATVHYLHFDPPGDGVRYGHCAARRFWDALTGLEMPVYAKTTGSKGMHLYVPIVRGPTQKQVWSFSKALSVEVAARHPKLMTAEYRKERRPAGRVLVDYNQNAWGRTLASIYSVRPHPRACVSTPVTWEEIDRGITIEDFRIDNVPARVRRRGDLWAPLVADEGRVDLGRFF